MDRGRVSPASEAVLPLSLEQQQQDHFDVNDDKYKNTLALIMLALAIKHPNISIS
jgi:hypothetical protein